LTEAEFDKLDYDEVLFYAGRIDEEKAEQVRRGMREAAFAVYLSGAGGKKSWRHYLGDIGLGDKLPKLSAEEKAEEVKRALSLAKKIKKLDQRKPITNG